MAGIREEEEQGLSDQELLCLPVMTGQSTQHTMARPAILGTRATASYYSRNTAKGCCKQCCIQNCGSDHWFCLTEIKKHVAAFQRSMRELSHDQRKRFNIFQTQLFHLI